MPTVVDTGLRKFSDGAAHSLAYGLDISSDTVQPITTIDGTLVVSDYLTAVGQNKITGHKPFQIIGYNPDIGVVQEDIQEWGGTYVPPAAGGIAIHVSSTSANDTAAGTGVQTVHVHYLDSLYAEHELVVTLNGTTDVAPTPTDVLRINYFHTQTAGSLGAADGTISVTSGATRTGTIYAQITPGLNLSRHGFFTIPAGKIGYLSGGFISVGGTTAGRSILANLRATCDHDGLYLPGIFQIKRTVLLIDSSAALKFDVPITIPAKTDIKFSAIDEAGSRVASFIEGWYEDL